MAERVNIIVRGLIEEELLGPLKELLKGQEVTISERVGPSVSETQRLLLEALVAAPGALSTVELRERTGVKENSVRPALARLREARLVRRVVQQEGDDLDLGGPADWAATDYGRSWLGQRSGAE